MVINYLVQTIFTPLLAVAFNAGAYANIEKDRTSPKAMIFKLFMILPIYNIYVVI